MVATQYQGLLASIATRIGDYRAGEIAPIDAQHVDRWISQFDPIVRLPILMEMDHVLERTYANRQTVVDYLTELVTHQPLVGAAPAQFWRAANIFQNQSRGNSQRELLTIFDSLLQQSFGFGIAACGSPTGPCIYIDDASFSGGRVRSDLEPWVRNSAPAHATIHVVVMAYYTYGRFDTDKRLRAAAASVGKSLNIQWWATATLEDRRSYNDRSDTLWPQALPNDPAVQAYAGQLQWQPVFRSGNAVGNGGVFGSPAGRALLESEFLRIGVAIRGMCPNLNAYQRPLGNKIMPTLGFGATVVTYRNCPNNCPLAWWAGDPWYPLFARRTN